MPYRHLHGVDTLGTAGATALYVVSAPAWVSVGVMAIVAGTAFYSWCWSGPPP